MTSSVEVIIVLGAQVRPEGKPSEALRRRLTLALACHKALGLPVICCGAQGRNEPMAEGDFMCGWLKERGVPAAMLYSENESFDTIQNIRYAKKIMVEKGFAKALVVTSDYHLCRALAICERYGVSADGVASPSTASFWIKNNARECLAWVKFLMHL